MSKDPVQVVQRWFEEVWNQRRSETIDELLTPESVCYGDMGVVRGPEEFRRTQFEPFIAAFPDLWVRVVDTLIEGEQVVVRWEATGNHTGDGLGIAGTDRPVALAGVTWIRVVDGKLMQGWQFSNIPTIFQSLGKPTEKAN